MTEATRPARKRRREYATWKHWAVDKLYTVYMWGKKVHRWLTR
jgi:hypothetical protein